MRRTCERPGCGAPSAMIYGYGTSSSGTNGPGTMWIDAWSPDRDPNDAPKDVRGVVCARHGELLSPPRGWAVDDRRDSVPRLFKPRDRGALSVVPDAAPEPPKKIKRDPTAPTRRPKASELPRPRLFADLAEQDVPAAATEPAPVVVEAAPVVEPAPVVIDQEPTDSVDDDSTELLIRQDASGSPSRVATTFDPDEDLHPVPDATGKMLRDALRPRLSGRWDPTAELLRPTDIESERF